MKMKEFGPPGAKGASLAPLILHSKMDEFWQNSCVKKWLPFHHDEHLIFLCDRYANSETTSEEAAITPSRPVPW